MSEVVAHLNEVLPTDAILTNGAGNYAAWLHRFIKHRAGGRQIAPTSGAMGYGVPAAIAAKIIHRDRTVVCFAGDGCFMMSAQELATAMQHDAAVIFWSLTMAPMARSGCTRSGTILAGLAARN
jgi:acetolactate synthase I/II/III large subunit